MSLDKLTLHAQLAVLAQNATVLDQSITDCNTQLQTVAVELERRRGARNYHDMLVAQIKAQLAQVEAEEKAALPSAAPAAVGV